MYLPLMKQKSVNGIDADAYDDMVYRDANYQFMRAAAAVRKFHARRKAHAERKVCSNG